MYEHLLFCYYKTILNVCCVRTQQTFNIVFILKSRCCVSSPCYRIMEIVSRSHFACSCPAILPSFCMFESLWQGRLYAFKFLLRRCFPKGINIWDGPSCALLVL